MSANTKVSKEIPTAQKYFECILEETGNNFAAKLTQQEKSNQKTPVTDTLCQFKTKWCLF